MENFTESCSPRVVVLNDYNDDYNQLLSMSERPPLLIVRLRALLIEVFKCVPDLIMLFTLNNKPYDILSEPLLLQSRKNNQIRD